MKTNEYTSPSAVALELELELRASGEQLRDSRVRIQEAESRAAAALQSAQRTDGIFRAITSAVGGGLKLASAVAPGEDLAVAQEACSLLSRFTDLTESEVGDAHEVVESLRNRGRSMGRDEKELDRELSALRAELLRQSGI